MPSLFAASMTVLPCGTCTARPSISMLSGGGELIRRPHWSIAGVIDTRASASPSSRGVDPFGPWLCPPRSYVRINHAALVLDVVLELAAEMLDEAFHRQCRVIAERTDRAALDVLGDRRQ